MGLIRAIAGAFNGVMADQWKDYFYCEALNADTLVTKGHKKGKNDTNVISNGSVIAVADGQCMIIVDQGKIAEVSCEPGEFLYDTATEPTIFSGDLGDTIGNVIDNIGRRITFGGEAPKDTRVYFVNTKELPGNKYGTANPVPFRVVDANIGLDIDISVKCFGEYSYRIVNPVAFYTNVCGNVSQDYTRANLDGQLKTELLTALQPAFAKISEMGIRYSALPAHTFELSNVLNEILSAKWKETRGIEIVSIGVSSVTASEEDAQMIKDLQKNAVLRDPTMAAAHLVNAQAAAMQSAASNANGAMMGFAGMNMASQAGGMNAANLFAMGAQNQTGPWTCSCGTVNNGKFCTECGNKRP
ncbi:MAG: SPFH domain-containing protein [Lachnospiraceae bacterium]|nr:SPFH domain-containing protein [Lachnospiraceae bacterium]